MPSKKILIFNPFGIGDVLFTTPLIRQLKDKIAGVSIAYICNQRTLPLLKNNIFLDKLFIFEKDEWRATLSTSKWKFFKKGLSFFNMIKKQRFDCAFDLSLNTQYGFFLRTTGIGIRIGYNFKKRGRFLTHRLELPFGYYAKHVARYYLELLTFLDIAPADRRFDLFIPQQNLAKTEEFLKGLGIDGDDFLVGVCPGSGDSWQKSAYFKRWPEGYFVELLRYLQKIRKVKIMLFGSKAEESLCEYVYNQLREKPVNLCGKIGLDDFCSLLSFCKIFITNDGGPFHIAQALGKPTVAFFGPVDERVYGAYPSAENSVILTKRLSCRPCYKAFRFRGCPFDKKCLKSISVEEAQRAIEKLIARFTPPLNS